MTLSIPRDGLRACCGHARALCLERRIRLGRGPREYMLAMRQSISRRRLAERVAFPTTHLRAVTCDVQTATTDHFEERTFMPDDTFINRNVIAVTFEEEASAFEAFSRLK
jgi:hypothetical protein